MTINHDDQIFTKAVNPAKSVHLSASAGSGKTRALKDRYLAILETLDLRGLTLDQAVAITFTDKAAAEIKERVLQDLPEPMLKKIIRGRQDLRISTIHSFCMNLLKRYPLEAGLPPDFGVLDSRDQAYKIQTAIEDALEGSDRNARIMGPLAEYTVDELMAMIEFLFSIRSRLNRINIDASGEQGLVNSVLRGLELERKKAALLSCLRSTEWRTGFRSMERILGAEQENYRKCGGKEHGLLADRDNIDTAAQLVDSLVPIYFKADGDLRLKTYLSKNACVGQDRAEYERGYFRIQELLARFRSLHADLQSGRCCVSLLQLFEIAQKKYQDSKLREGLLDFDDLEIYAYRLMQKPDSLDLLYWLDRKILHFLVDEFQDTSDIQWAILKKVTEEIFAGEGADKPVRPTLFIVGDKKQSIYRFREADYRLIDAVREKMELHIEPPRREVLTLDKNFRSTPEIIESVNTVFSGLWKSDYSPSQPSRTKQRGTVRIIELRPSGPDLNHPAPSEAELLAREIKLLIDRGTTIYERTSTTTPGSGSSPLDGEDNGMRATSGGVLWKERPAGYGDCAVLIQSRTKLKGYEAALQKEGIPFRVVGGIGFYEEEEIQALLNVLFFLWNREDALSLAAALKSPLFGMDNAELFDLMNHGGNMIDALKHQRPQIGKHLSDWIHISGLVSLSSIIHRIIEDTGAYIRFGRRNPQAIFNIDKLLDTAREFDRRGHTTLQDFGEWVKNIRETEQREATADMNLPGFEGAVSILTVHKAKGLEFPAVFLPGLNQTPLSLQRGPEALISERDDSVLMAVKRAPNALYDGLWEEEKNERRREHQRLLYVAMTRSRDHLVMIGTADREGAAKKDTWLDYLHSILPVPAPEIEGPCTIRYSWPDWNAPDIDHSFSTGKSSTSDAVKSKGLPDFQSVLNNLSPLHRSESDEWKRATDFIREREEGSPGPTEKPEGSPVSLISRGSVLHRALEDLTKTGQYDFRAILKQFPDIMALGIDIRDSFISEAESIIRSVVQDKGSAWIFENYGRAYSELPFLLRKNRSLISGIIDRVIIQNGKGYVVDYKAIAVENERSLNAWKEHYRPQLTIYCEAVQQIFQVKRVEGYLLFLDSTRLELTVPIPS